MMLNHLIFLVSTQRGREAYVHQLDPAAQVLQNWQRSLSERWTPSNEPTSSISQLIDQLRPLVSTKRRTLRDVFLLGQFLTYMKQRYEQLGIKDPNSWMKDHIGLDLSKSSANEYRLIYKLLKE